MGLYDFTFYDMIGRNAALFGDRPAWIELETGEQTSFAAIRTEVDRLAAGLADCGLARGQRIGVLAQNSLAYFLLYGAAAALGAIVVPINWRLSVEEVCFNLADTGPIILAADAAYQEMLDVNQEKLPTVRHRFGLSRDGFWPALDTVKADADQVFPPPAVSEDDGLVIIHTAAVAGRPRGALLSHANLLCANLHWQCRLQISPEDVHLNLLPLFHVGGLFMAASSFHAGALNVNLRKFEAATAAEAIERYKATVMFDFSPILGNILDVPGRDLGSLRAVTGLDTPGTIERYQQRTGGTFYAMYGQTETACIATYGRYDDRPGAAGRPISLADLRLLDEHDRPVSTGQVGEIAMRGPMVFKGYWNLPEDNAYTFRDGWHHTGDLGRFDADGFLWYAGRKADKELIKPGGENVYPAEVEKAILAHPAVVGAVVFGVPDPKWKEGIKAVCVLVPGASLSAGELIDFVGGKIARYKKPQYVEFVEDLPRDKEGRPDRQRIKEIYGGPQG
ncbi:MAG: AMP-binding protein [Desulfobacteraceae bacterium]|jgi:long-chain acyl-CoA synthetase|nr:AMP-binding protein [Desulfobacteraceae bacterium]